MLRKRRIAWMFFALIGLWCLPSVSAKEILLAKSKKPASGAEKDSSSKAGAA